ncbi:hypothetical protein GCM10011348_13310 [Marinobacterium nitratireducens]|uniref:peptidylprolyl isomerase n=1 Tax=Marinobacterium nitratireducens TaxID=518897 RepID=A0A917ZAB9_9GAMM|nr:peptidylprolyl isomerase [Marinobacterium nitratireducens]GGO79321.1 hypothetical protein GCM10011348_13310 [Marinobacterium nitratireducens]
MRRLLQEPLLHFLLLGTLIFGFYGVLSGEDAKSENDAVVVSAGQVESLAANFTKLWQRAPSEQELKGLVDQYVKEEILSREAVKLGLDQNDTVIRRRLQQKMEFVAEGLVAVSRPDDDELAAYLSAHPEKFAREPRFSFRQVFLDPGKQGAALAEVTADLRRQLRDGADPAGLGDGLMLPAAFADASRTDVANTFGKAFASQLGSLQEGSWSGPVASGYGVHLVFLERKQAASLPQLAEVRDEVERSLMAERRSRANADLLDGLLSKYDVRVDWPQAAPAIEISRNGEQQ